MYYYFSATLPELKPGETPPLTIEEFDYEAQDLLTPEHYRQLTADTRDESERPPRVIREMRRFEEYLRNRIAVRRAEKLNRPLDLETPEEFYGEVDAALPAIAALDPAERERAIDLLRWRKLDELDENHGFDFDHICVYRAKLLLAEKYRARDAVRGRRRFDEAVMERF